MERYKITNELRDKIRDSRYSFDQLSRILGFQVKNICNHNLSINEKHLNVLKEFLKLNINLRKIKFNYAKNLGRYAISAPILKLKKTKYTAEIIGILLGDGSIYRNSIKIAFDKRNKRYINYVKNLFKESLKINLKKQIYNHTNNAYLYYYNKNLVKNLIKLELQRGDKIKNQIGIPKWIKRNKEYSKYCIKGLIDTDGCIYTCKREKQTYIKFTNHNPKLLKDFKEVTKTLDYSFANSNKTNICLYRKKQVVKFINGIKPYKAKIMGLSASLD